MKELMIEIENRMLQYIRNHPGSAIPKDNLEKNYIRIQKEVYQEYLSKVMDRKN